MTARQHAQGLPTGQFSEPAVAGVFGHLGVGPFGHISAEGLANMQDAYTRGGWQKAGRQGSAKGVFDRAQVPQYTDVKGRFGLRWESCGGWHGLVDDADLRVQVG